MLKGREAVRTHTRRVPGALRDLNHVGTRELPCVVFVVLIIIRLVILTLTPALICPPLFINGYGYVHHCDIARRGIYFLWETTCAAAVTLESQQLPWLLGVSTESLSS